MNPATIPTTIRRHPERTVPDILLLPDQLIQALPGDDSLASRIDVHPMAAAG